VRNEGCSSSAADSGEESSHTAASKGGYSGRSASGEDALCAGSRHEGLQGGGGLGPKTGAGHPSSTERETSTNSAKDESVGHSGGHGPETQSSHASSSRVCSDERLGGDGLTGDSGREGSGPPELEPGQTVRLTPGSSEQPTGTGPADYCY